MRSCWNLRLNSFLLIIFQTVLSIGLMAQFSLPYEVFTSKTTDLPPYLFPVNPGQPNSLAGTMGELRSTHFHAGIDVRTNNMVGVPILATQQGYFSRVMVSAYGYGNAVMIRHPDGNTSLYGHLDRFKGPIADHILREQYKNKSFDIDLVFESNQFPVNRGDTIGFSGNTGGSSGPHLHFEIRDQNDEALNPLAFGFKEIIDTHSPIAFKVALTTMDNNSRVNDRFGRFEFNLVRSGNSYSLPYPIFAIGKIGVEVLAHDKIDLSRFRCGINYIEMLIDSTRIFAQEIKKFNFEEARDIVTLMDFKTLKTKGVRFNKLFLADGNPLKFYDGVVSKGLIHIGEGIRKVNITLRDFSGNKSNVKFSLKADPITKEAKFLESMKLPLEYDIIENTMVVNVKAQPGMKPTPIEFFYNGKGRAIMPDYSNSYRQVYLIDLRKEIPDSAQTSYGSLKFYLKDVVPSGTDYDYYSNLLDIKFADGNLYDTMYLNVSHEMSTDGREKFTIGSLHTPLRNSISITLKPQLVYPSSEKTDVYHMEGGRAEYLASEWRNGKVQFNTHELGQFTLLTDSLPPNIGRIYCNDRSARFRISDNLSGIASFEANINGEWLLMKYDYKTGIIQSERLDSKKPLKGEFELKVMDRAGNQRTYKQQIP
jgi:hypothetical protein